MTILAFPITAPGGGKFTLYGEKSNIEYFIKTTITSAVDAGVTNKQVSVKASSRQQYPGDATTINMPATSREVLIDPTAKSGNALPGRSITLVGDPGMPGEERRTFTLKGRWIDFHAWLSANAKMMTYAYNSSGRRYTIKAAQAGP